jgi:zinc D-Ala-D-Ala carboxypeptidase
MIRLTPHFTLQELTFSQTAARKGIDNTPEPKILDNLFILANGMEDVRNLLNAPVHISSGYRCIELNDLLGSKRTSQHTQGLACDFTSNAYGTPSDIVLAIVSSDIPYDQVILEYDRWVHISFVEDGGIPRKQALIINGEGAMIYQPSRKQ